MVFVSQRKPRPGETKEAFHRRFLGSSDLWWGIRVLSEEPGIKKTRVVGLN